MPFTYIDHTGDVGIQLHASTLEDLLDEASRAFIDILTDPAEVRASSSETIELRAPDPSELLHTWLEELLFLFDTKEFLGTPESLAVDTDSQGDLLLRARLRGESMDTNRHPFRVQIKAVTYHCLEVREMADHWSGTVVFDI